MSTSTIQDIIADYFKTQPVLKAWLFGSYSRGEQKPWSDIDILVQYDRQQPIGLFKIAGMKVDLEDMLDCEVDLVEDGRLRPWAVESINRDKILIYERAYQRPRETGGYSQIWQECGAHCQRNILVHGYSQVSDADLWETATHDIGPFCKQVEQYLEEIDWDAWLLEEDPYTEMDNVAYRHAVDSALRMISKGFSYEDISEITGLNINEICSLKE